MVQAASVVTQELAGRLSAEGGLAYSVEAAFREAGLELEPCHKAEIVARHMAPELNEKSAAVKYPQVHVYCERVENTLREKFRRFSGTVRMAVEVRVSHDHIEPLEQLCLLYAGAVTDVLERNRGTWSECVLYTGEYEVSFAQVKRGGRHFLQTAKVQLDVNVGAG